MGPSGSAFREDLAVKGIMEKDYQNKKQRGISLTQERLAKGCEVWDSL